MTPLRVALINAGRLTFTSLAVSPPVGLLYLAAYARAHLPVSVKIVDQRGLDLPNDQVVRQVRDFSPQVIGIRCLTANAGTARELTEAFRQECPNALLVAGGPHASAMGAKLLEDMTLDVVIPGEGEISFQKLLQAVADKSDFSEIPGLLWKNHAGDMVRNPGTPEFVEDIDTIPMPAYDLIDIPVYSTKRTMSLLPYRKHYFCLFTSRGCPYRCNYCHSIFGKRFRAHSAERVVEEITCLWKNHGIHDFDILDDIFNMDRERVFRIVELLKQKNINPNFSFPNGIRTDLLTEETVDALHDMGTYICAFALETGSPRLQKLIGKNLNLEKYLRGVALAARKRIFCYGFAMLGFPGESADEMDMTINIACQSELHAINFFTVTPFPGTALFEQAMREHPDRLQRLDYEGKDYLFKLTANLSQVSDKELQRKLKEANRRFYLTPRRIARMIRDYPDFRQLASQAVRFLYLQTLNRAF
ncbi:MAG TPA: radical SAM protein [Candidatus Hydrogenedentes bacterium]|nr:radical SAM protein [Candidatus Hydrogenedentota bacterium]